MTKELEALKNIKREAGTPYFSTLYDIDMLKEDFAIIETALKALEIIKNKYWLVEEIIESKGNWEVYQSWCSIFRANMEYRATREEFDLLKEVLL